MNQCHESRGASNNFKNFTVVNVLLPLTVSLRGHSLVKVADHLLIKPFVQFLKKRMRH